MAIEKIVDDDRRYFEWLKINPDGYVANTSRRFVSSYYTVHHAACLSINAGRNYKRGAFTERHYIKIVSSGIGSLLDYAKANGFEKCKSCSRCNSNLKTNDTLQNEVADSLLLPLSERRKRLAEAPQKPSQRITVVREFIRNPDVIAEALWLAKGRCHSCGNQAPFSRTRDNSPYLEVHHRLPLAEGGLDIVENAIALCPNCHRREHFGQALHRP